MSEPSGEILRLLEEHPWNETMPQLLRYANFKLKRLRWLGERSGTPPKAMEATDVVQTAFEKVWSGTRAWDPSREPDLRKHLTAIVDSEVNNLATLAENRRTRREVPGSTAEAVDSLDFTSRDGRDPNPEEILLANEACARGDEYVLGFWLSLEAEPELQEVVGVIIDDIVTPAKIAARLGVLPDEIYKRKKLLRRRLEDYQEVVMAQARIPAEGGDA